MSHRSIYAQDGKRRAKVLVDEDVHEELSRFAWHLLGAGYAARNVPRPGRGTIYMHRQIMGLEPGDGKEVDHINGQRLDNRRANLRIVSRSENLQNIIRRGHSSELPGVNWDGSRGRWRAELRHGGSRHFLGRYDTELEAGRAVYAFLLEHRPEGRALDELEAAFGRKPAEVTPIRGAKEVADGG